MLYNKEERKWIFLYSLSYKLFEKWVATNVIRIMGRCRFSISRIFGPANPWMQFIINNLLKRRSNGAYIFWILKNHSLKVFEVIYICFFSQAWRMCHLLSVISCRVKIIKSSTQGFHYWNKYLGNCILVVTKVLSKLICREEKYCIIIAQFWITRRWKGSELLFLYMI